MDAQEIPLEEVLRELRVQLLGAMEAGKGKALKFEIKELELELQMVVTKAVEGKGGLEGQLKFWVLNALGKTELGGKYERSQLQTLRLKLDPKTSAGKRPDLAG